MNEKNVDTKFIRHRYGKYSINKTIKGKKKHFGTYDTLDEAIIARDELIATNWGYPDEEDLTQRKIGKYDSKKNRKIWPIHRIPQWCLQSP